MTLNARLLLLVGIILTLVGVVLNLNPELKTLAAVITMSGVVLLVSLATFAPKAKVV